jgi:DNA polymerase III subunit epsilon
MSYNLPKMSIDPDRVWHDNGFAVFDTETTGVEPDSKAVEIAVVHVDGANDDVSTWSVMLNPGCSIPKGASKIHGITDAKVKEKGAFADVYDELVLQLRGKVPVAYNFSYDWQILRNEAKRLGKPWFGFFAIDPMVLARHFIPYVPGGYSLTSLTRHLDMHDDDAADHRATDDAVHTAKVLLEGVASHLGEMTLRQLWNLQVDAARAHEERMRIRIKSRPVDQPWHDYTRRER